MREYLVLGKRSETDQHLISIQQVSHDESVIHWAAWREIQTVPNSPRAPLVLRFKDAEKHGLSSSLVRWKGVLCWGSVAVRLLRVVNVGKLSAPTLPAPRGRYWINTIIWFREGTGAGCTEGVRGVFARYLSFQANLLIRYTREWFNYSGTRFPSSGEPPCFGFSFLLVGRYDLTMDYSYLNQAAASFDSSGMDAGLGNMPCSYSDLTSCSQMSQAAYRYTAAAASMARGYTPSGGMVPHHPGSGGGAHCAVMGGRQDVHRAPIFPTTMNLQGMMFHFSITMAKDGSFIAQKKNSQSPQSVVLSSLISSSMELYLWGAITRNYLSQMCSVSGVFRTYRKIYNSRNCIQSR